MVTRIGPRRVRQPQNLCQLMLAYITVGTVYFCGDEEHLHISGTLNNPISNHWSSLYSPKLTLCVPFHNSALKAHTSLKRYCDHQYLPLCGNVAKYSAAQNDCSFWRRPTGGCMIATGQTCSSHSSKFWERFERFIFRGWERLCPEEFSMGCTLEIYPVRIVGRKWVSGKPR